MFVLEMGAGPHMLCAVPWIATKEAAPPVVPFDRWAPRTMVSGPWLTARRLSCGLQAAVVTDEREVEVRRASGPAGRRRYASWPIRGCWLFSPETRQRGIQQGRDFRGCGKTPSGEEIRPRRLKPGIIVDACAALKRRSSTVVLAVAGGRPIRTGGRAGEERKT